MNSFSIRSEADVEHALEGGRTRSAMKWVWILGFGGVFFEAYSGAALATGLGPLVDELGLSSLQVSLTTSLYMIVAIVLCPFAGALADKVGRLPLIMGAKAIAVVSMVIGLTSQNFEMLLASRLLAGVAWAMDFGVVLAYVSEFLPRSAQNKLSRWQGVWYVATSTNLLIAVVIYEAGVGQSIWRWMLGTAAIFALLLLVLQKFLLVESPRWLASRGRNDEAAVALNRMYEPLPGFTPATETASASQVSSSDGPRVFTDVFKGIYLRRTILSSSSFMLQAWQYYAIGWYLPVVALTLFGDSFVEASLGAALFNILGIVGGFSAAAMTSRLGIRRAAQLGFGLVAVMLIAFGLLISDMPTPLAVAIPSLFILFHSALCSTSGANFSAMAYPSSLRAMGMGVSTTACNIGAAAGLFSFPLLEGHLGTSGAVLASAVVPALGLLVNSVIRWDPDRDAKAPLGDSALAPSVATPIH